MANPVLKLHSKAAASANSITRADLVKNFARWRKLSPRLEEIVCESINSVSFRDILDLYLRWNGAGHAVWRDGRGRSDAVQPAGHAIYNLLRDVVIAPKIFVQTRRRLQELKTANCKIRVTSSANDAVLYLRTDHWFHSVEGGALSHTTGIVNALKRLGHKVDLVTAVPLPGLEGQNCHLVEPIYSIGRNIRHLPLLAYNDQLATYISERWQEWRPHFVYQRLSAFNYTGALLRMRYRVPYICEYNGSSLWMARNWDRQRLGLPRLARQIERLSLMLADLVVAVSDAARAELIECGVPASRIVVIPNGVDVERFVGGHDGAEVRRQYGLQEKLVIGFVGTFGPWHGADVLARAFVSLRARRPELAQRTHLLLMGDGAGRAIVEGVFAGAGLQTATSFTGIVQHDAIPDHLAACDVLVSPHVPNPDGSRFAGSPTKLFEYMAAGKAIVASDLEQIGTLLSHGKTGWLVPPADPEALSCGMEILLDNPLLRRRLGEAAREAAEKQHSWTSRVRQLIEALPH